MNVSSFCIVFFRVVFFIFGREKRFFYSYYSFLLFFFCVFVIRKILVQCPPDGTGRSEPAGFDGGVILDFQTVYGIYYK